MSIRSTIVQFIFVIGSNYSQRYNISHLLVNVFFKCCWYFHNNTSNNEHRMNSITEDQKHPNSKLGTTIQRYGL